MNKSYPAAQGTEEGQRPSGRLLKMKSDFIFYFSWSVMKYHNSNKLLGWVGSLRSFLKVTINNQKFLEVQKPFFKKVYGRRRQKKTYQKFLRGAGAVFSKRAPACQRQRKA